MLYLEKVNTKYGAPMGRTQWNECKGISCRGSIQQLAMTDGYDSGGAYWGMPNNVYCAQYNYFNKHTNEEYSGRMFVRANSRQEAIQQVNKIPAWKNVRFKKR